MSTLQIANLAIDIVRKDIKNIHLAVYPPSGRVRLAAPLRVTDEAIRLFAISKIAWIKKNQRKLLSQVRQSPREYISGESHYYLGSRYLLEVIETKEKQKIEIRGKAKIRLYVHTDSTKEHKEALMNEWYRKELKNILPELIEKWKEKTGISCDDWRVRQMKTRWGTCNIKAKRVWLNLELAKKPIHAIEYVIAHELSHFLEKHHNERFIAHMDTFYSGWRTVKAELNGIL